MVVSLKVWTLLKFSSYMVLKKEPGSMDILIQCVSEVGNPNLVGLLVGAQAPQASLSTF